MITMVFFPTLQARLVLGIEEFRLEHIYDLHKLGCDPMSPLCADVNNLHPYRLQRHLQQMLSLVLLQVQLFPVRGHLDLLS